MDLTTTAPCADCASEIEHCHGTLIDHHDGAVECTDGDCANLDSASHPLHLRCDEVNDGCGCLGERLPELLVAS